MILLTALKDVLPLVRDAAPILADAIGGPASGWVIGLLSNAFGASPGDLDGLAKNIMNEPSAKTMLANLEEDYQTKIKPLLGPNFKMPSNVEINIRLTWNDPVSTA